MQFLPTLISARPALAAFAAMGMGWGCFAAALPDLKAMLGVDEARLGLLLLAAPVAAVSAMLLAPRTGVMLGRLALPLAVLAMAMTFGLLGQAGSGGPAAVLCLFALGMAGCGATTGTLDVLMNARVAELENSRDLHLMNLCHAAYSLGYAGAAIATGGARAAGWSPAMVMGAAGLAAAIMALMAYERDGTITGLVKPKGGFGAGLGTVPLIGGAVVLIAFMSENASENWSALHIEKTLGGSATEGSMGPAALALTMGLARLAGQGLITRIPAHRLLTGGAVLAAIGALIVAAAGSPAVAYGGFIVMGIGASVIAPTAFSLVGRMAAPAARARAVARATLMGYFGYFFGPPTLGFIAGAFGLRAAFGFAALMLMAVLVLAPLMRQAAR